MIECITTSHFLLILTKRKGNGKVVGQNTQVYTRMEMFGDKVSGHNTEVELLVQYLHSCCSMELSGGVCACE